MKNWETWPVICLHCHTERFNYFWTNGKIYEFTCLCGTAMEGPIEQIPASLKKPSMIEAA